jgi:hypothetical protein
MNTVLAKQEKQTRQTISLAEAAVLYKRRLLEREERGEIPVPDDIIGSGAEPKDISAEDKAKDALRARVRILYET